MTPVYRWEMQTMNPDTGGWHFTDRHPRGHSASTSSPDEFAFKVAVVHGQLAPDDRFRIAVWDGDRLAATREFGPGTL